MLTLSCVAAPPVCCVEQLLTDPVGHAQHALAALKLTSVCNLQQTPQHMHRHHDARASTHDVVTLVMAEVDQCLRSTLKSKTAPPCWLGSAPINHSQSRQATMQCFALPAGCWSHHECHESSQIVHQVVPMHVRLTQTNISAAHNLHKQPKCSSSEKHQDLSSAKHAQPLHCEQRGPMSTDKRCRGRQAHGVGCGCPARCLAAPS